LMKRPSALKSTKVLIHQI